MNVPFLLRFIIFGTMTVLYTVSFIYMCENALKFCHLESNVCYKQVDAENFNYVPYAAAIEIFSYSILFLFTQSYIVADREYMMRVKTYRDTQEEMQRKTKNDQEQHLMELLKRMLPESVAEVLKRHNGETIAKKFDEVSILFTDMKGFTAFSSTVTPVELMRFLDRMFTTFDHIADKYGLYKVEIIGDAYFCVCNCPDPNLDHAANMASAALELLDAIPELQKLAGTTFELRVGMHIGPVVGGVVGINNPRYHVFGDSVTLANLMESTGEVGRLHCSEAVFNKLKTHSDFEFNQCPVININGFGSQRTYFLSDRYKSVRKVSTLVVQNLEEENLLTNNDACE